MGGFWKDKMINTESSESSGVLIPNNSMSKAGRQLQTAVKKVGDLWAGVGTLSERVTLSLGCDLTLGKIRLPRRKLNLPSKNWGWETFRCKGAEMMGVGGGGVGGACRVCVLGGARARYVMSNSCGPHQAPLSVEFSRQEYWIPQP